MAMSISRRSTGGVLRARTRRLSLFNRRINVFEGNERISGVSSSLHVSAGSKLVMGRSHFYSMAMVAGSFIGISVCVLNGIGLILVILYRMWFDFVKVF